MEAKRIGDTEFVIVMNDGIHMMIKDCINDLFFGVTASENVTDNIGFSLDIRFLKNIQPSESYIFDTIVPSTRRLACVLMYGE